jgi:N-acetylglucosamine kinase-like BadF-type ATPase
MCIEWPEDSSGTFPPSRLATVLFCAALKHGINNIRPELAYSFYMRCVLGFDGGATKTECVLVNEAGNILASGRSGASNPTQVGFERTIEEIKKAAQAAMSEARVRPEAISALCAGIAGAGAAKAADRMRALLAAAFPSVPMKVCTDLEIALAATGAGPAIVLIAGTGSGAMGRGANGEVRRTGGLGAQVGDQGSARDVGRQAAAAARSERDQTGEESAFGKQLKRQLGIAHWRELENRGDVPLEQLYPQLFPVVANAADAGDATARELLRAAALDLASLVRTLADDLSLQQVPFRLAKTGGMIGHCAFFDSELDARLREATPTAKIGLLPISAAHAAALLALDLFLEAD